MGGTRLFNEVWLWCEWSLPLAQHLFPGWERMLQPGGLSTWVINSEGRPVTRGLFLCWYGQCVPPGLWNSNDVFHFVFHWRLWKSSEGKQWWEWHCTNWRRTERQNQVNTKIEDSAKPGKYKNRSSRSMLNVTNLELSGLNFFLLVSEFLLYWQLQQYSIRYY